MRLDLYLVHLGTYPTRALARESIKAGKVRVLIAEEWRIVKKPGFETQHDQAIKAETEEFFWVSRAAHKIQGACKTLNVDVMGKRVLDLGQSTGGFTQYFLNSGAKKVTGVDVGRDQLHESLRSDKRVEFYEGCDARDLSFLDDQEFDFFSADLSFISLLKVAPEIKRLLGSRSIEGMFLVKPQFEVGRANIAKGGIVKNQESFLLCQKVISKGLEEMGYEIFNYLPSHVRGKDGNQEFICHVST